MRTLVTFMKFADFSLEFYVVSNREYSKFTIFIVLEHKNAVPHWDLGLGQITRLKCSQIHLPGEYKTMQEAEDKIKAIVKGIVEIED